MTYAITQTCCSDATCIAVCPVNCIHPTPEERDFGSTEMLHIDPKSCIDCGACADACPVDAIVGAPKHQHHVLAERCTGCELCLPPCPVDCIAMKPLNQAWTAADAERGAHGLFAVVR